MGALVGVQPGFPTAAMDGDRPATEGTPSDDELRRRLAALNVERVSQGLKPRSFRDFKKSFLRPGRRTRNGLLLEDYPQAEASSVAADAGTVLQERDMLPPRPPASKRAKTEDVPGEVSLRSASEVRGQMETEDANLAEASSTESLVAPEGQEIILRSVSELREFAGEHRSPGHSREEASSSAEAGAPVPNYHIQVEVQANRRNPRLAHHWFGEKITVVKDLVRGRPIPRQITLHRLGKGNSRVVYEWGAFVVKFTTVVVDHGDEEQLTVLLPEVTALVIHVVPVIARMGSFTRSRPARGLCPNPKEGDHGSELAGRVGCGDAPPLALLPSMHGSVAEQQGPKPGRCDRFQLGAGDPGWTPPVVRPGDLEGHRGGQVEIRIGVRTIPPRSMPRSAREDSTPTGPRAGENV